MTVSECVRDYIEVGKAIMVGLSPTPRKYTQEELTSKIKAMNPEKNRAIREGRLMIRILQNQNKEI